MKFVVGDGVAFLDEVARTTVEEHSATRNKDFELSVGPRADFDGVAVGAVVVIVCVGVALSIVADEHPAVGSGLECVVEFACLAPIAIGVFDRK